MSYELERKHLLTEEEINNLITIINSDLSDFEKAKQLRAVCKGAVLLNNINKYETTDFKKAVILKRVLSYYEKYEQLGYMKTHYTPYKCTPEELGIRKEKLIKLSQTLNSNISEYNKAMTIFELYKDSEVFRRSYSLFVKLGASDPRLDSIREELKNVDYYYNKMKEYERLGYLIDYRYYQKTTDYREIYPYAKYITNQYLNTNSYNFNDFLECYGLTENAFNFCLETLKELDVDLFNQYQEKHQISENLLLMHNIEIFKDLSLGITTGHLKDGTEFNAFEFFKRLPISSNGALYTNLKKYFVHNKIEGINLILNYVCRNNFQVTEVTKTLDSEQILNSYNNNPTLDINAIRIILTYLQQNNIPINKITYNYAKNMYLNNEFNISIILEHQDQIKSQKKTLIP